jgi:hypothetical protein
VVGVSQQDGSQPCRQGIGLVHSLGLVVHSHVPSAFWLAGWLVGWLAGWLAKHTFVSRVLWPCLFVEVSNSLLLG